MTMNINGRVLKVKKNLSSGEIVNMYAQRFQLEQHYTMAAKDENSLARVYTATLELDGRTATASGPNKKKAKAEAANNFINNVFHSGGNSPRYGIQVNPGKSNKFKPGKELKNMAKMTKFNRITDEKLYRAGDFGRYSDFYADGFDLRLRPEFWQWSLVKANEMKRRRLTRIKMSVLLETVNEDDDDDEDLEQIYAPVRPASKVADPPVKPPVTKSTKPEQQARPVYTPVQCRVVSKDTTILKKTATSSKTSSKLSLVDKSSVNTPAYESRTLPRQSPPGHVSQVILSAEDIQSQSNLSVRLVSEEAALLQLVAEMNEKPPPEVKGWTVSKWETVAVHWDRVWYRGLAVKKREGKFSIYLLDFGGSLVTVAPDKLRPLPAKLRTIPAAAYQVCLAGMGPLQGVGGDAGQGGGGGVPEHRDAGPQGQTRWFEATTLSQG